MIPVSEPFRWILAMNSSSVGGQMKLARPGTHYLWPISVMEYPHNSVEYQDHRKAGLWEDNLRFRDADYQEWREQDLAM